MKSNSIHVIITIQMLQMKDYERLYLDFVSTYFSEILMF